VCSANLAIADSTALCTPFSSFAYSARKPFAIARRATPYVLPPAGCPDADCPESILYLIDRLAIEVMDSRRNLPYFVHSNFLVGVVDESGYPLEVWRLPVNASCNLAPPLISLRIY